MTYGLDAAGQVTSLTGTLGGTATAYVSGIQYTAAGGLSTLSMPNGVTQSYTWNSLQEPTSIQAGNLLTLNHTYCRPGDPTPCPSGNTGSPYTQSIVVGGQTRSVQAYTHDSLDRLTAASEWPGATAGTLMCPDSTSLWCRQYQYDTEGNRTISATSSTNTDQWQAGTYNAANNQATGAGWSYDAGGNVKAAPGASALTFDAEGRLVAYGGTTYAYDGDGQRVQKTDAYGTVTTFVYDAFGELDLEEQQGGSVAVPGGTTQYLAVDALGSTRLVMTGAQASERHDYLPYGLEVNNAEAVNQTLVWRPGVTGYGVDTVRQKFTGQERDSESLLDYFHARYYAPGQGRFVSPDPGNAGADLGDSQSWNGYA